jgi:hypothetical protein
LKKLAASPCHSQLLYNIGNGQSAVFRVQAVYVDGSTSDWVDSGQVNSPDDSTTLDANTTIADPSPKLTLTTISGTTATFRWSIDPTEPELLAQLEYVSLDYNKYDSGADESGQVEDTPVTTGPFPPTFTITGLTPNTHYDFMIDTNWFNDDVQHDMYDHVDGFTTNGPSVVVTPVPPAPQSVSATYIPGTGGAPGYVAVHWVNSSPDETGFEVWRSDNGGPYSQIYTAKADETSYNDKGLSDLGPWTYEVRAVNDAGPSPFTLSTQASPIDGPDITAHLNGIAAQFDRQWGRMSSEQQLGFSLQFLVGDVGDNFDISDLADHKVASSSNDGVLPGGNGDQGVTVTVSGQVYRQVEVDYFLYGLIFAKIDASPDNLTVAEDFIFIHRLAELLHGNALNLSGRDAWFEAGYYRNFSLATPAAVSGVAPAPAPNGTTVPDVPPLGWFAGEDPYPIISGFD